MANYKPIGVPFDRTFRNDLNENFKTLDGVASSAKADTETAKQAATSAAQSAQIAQADAISAKQASELAVSKADETQAQLDDIIIESGTSDAELVQARGGETLLYKRLDKTDAQLEIAEMRINNINAPVISPIEIIAHRGFAELGPENTVPAFSQAIGVGATSLECDVQITSDGVPVVIHDSTVDRTTDGIGKVQDMTLTQLRSLDAGTRFSPFYEGAKIPTFDEFLKLAKGRSLRVYPEIKGIRSYDDIKLIIDAVKENGMENTTTIQSFTFAHLDKVREYSSVVKIAYLIFNSDLSQYALDRLTEDKNGMVLYEYSYILSKPNIVRQLYSLGIDLGVWVVPNKQASRKLLNLGVTKQMCDMYLGGDQS